MLFSLREFGLSKTLFMTCRYTVLRLLEKTLTINLYYPLLGNGDAIVMDKCILNIAFSNEQYFVMSWIECNI